MFSTHQRAETFARRAEAWTAKYLPAEDWTSRERAALNPYDPTCRWDYTGVTYSVIPATMNPPLTTKRQEDINP